LSKSTTNTMIKNYYLRTGLLVACLIANSIGFAQTYTFTSATATGTDGPTQVMVDAEYTGTTLDGTVTVTGGIQYWVVPTTGVYLIEGFGGQGFGSFGGRGAHISGEFNLTAGTTLKILVGQKAPPPVGSLNQYAGGGGSFVTTTTNSPFIVAGGGGGNHGTSFVTTSDASITNAGFAGVAANSGAGGTAGSGGVDASSADAGGGLLGNGGGIGGGFAFVNGGIGGAGTTSGHGEGGFGCGGGTSSWDNYRAGGGGGYSGGGGAGENGQVGAPAAGGGGSFNSGTSPVNLAGVQLGDGMIVITNQCAPAVGTLAGDVDPLPDVSEDCSSTPTAPTATNSCTSGIVGTPDVSFPITTVGTTVVTWTYDDGINIVTQVQNVIITGFDVTPPVVDNANLPDVGGQCDFTPSTPTATDACTGGLAGVADVTFPLFTQGLTVVTWTYTDPNGNSVTQTQNITLNDVAPPNLDIPNLPDYTGCGSATPPTATATDFCSGALNGTSDVTFPITAAGPTTVTWTYIDNNGNSVSQTQDVYVTAVDLTVTLNAATISANATGVTYQWMDCGTGQLIPGETGQTYTAIATGDYAVIITTGTCVDTSACTLVDFTGIDELNSNAITVYPNPTSGSFKIDFEGNIENIVLFDALGRIIDVPSDLATGKIDGSNLATGKYTISVITADSIYRQDIVVVK
jgi:hypothetical protein